MMKSAVAYLRGEFAFLRPESQTTRGFWISAPLVIREALQNADAEAFGKAVARALEESTVGIPHPEKWDDVTAPLLELAGVKTWNSFEKSARCCGIEKRGTAMVFVPMENLRREGFQSLDNLKFEISAASSDEEIGAALLKAFDLSR